MEQINFPRPGALVTAIAGRMDSSTSGGQIDALVEAIDACDGDLELSLADVPQVTAAGVRCLIVAAKLMQSQGRRLWLTELRPDVEEFLLGRGHTHLLGLQRAPKNARPSQRQPAQASESERAVFKPKPVHATTLSGVHVLSGKKLWFKK
ncbi:hypothetical protein SAMN05444004_12521 [Jannaschia faecimaris]|uniref:STAS domain-containing protein n=1 Tax=Jannaschia faecimaris TaxID=1244108 RepID=A0A1H3U7J0_9RHOB|nr:STAS domain-containing protein [Jannaschia faecimaris]SDZ58372.1 hypothetical protein SAMN05444004_12521 [Jannaschia faecimaris]